MSIEFEWDPTKSAANLKRHGVGFPEALAVFTDPLARIFDDPDHSDDERREIIIGHSSKLRLIVCVLYGASGEGPSNQCAQGHEARAQGL
jgi:uncharacterized protein